jgi:hypothetical protein
MREQLGHLLSLAEAQGIVLQVLPFAVSDAPGVGGPAAHVQMLTLLSVRCLPSSGLEAPYVFRP